jgi:hypothetical protein
MDQKTEKPAESNDSESTKQSEGKRRADEKRSRESGKHFQGRGTEKHG